MTERRREKIKKFGATLPLPEVHGPESGDVLLVGWGSTWGPIREATAQAVEAGLSVSSIHIRHVHPLPNGLEDLFARFKHVLVFEMNDEGLYGYGQLATLLRARYCDPRIQSVCKTSGLTFRIRDILEAASACLS